MPMIASFAQGSQSSAPARASNSDAVRQEVQKAIEDANAAARDARRASDQDGVDRVIVNRDGITIHRPMGTPGVSGPWEGDPRGIPSGVVDISIGFFFMCAFIAVGWPIARAFGKRVERRGERAAASPAMTDQLQRIEQAVEAMAIEVERISESQRFLTKLQSGAAQERLGAPK